MTVINGKAAWQQACLRVEINLSPTEAHHFSTMQSRFYIAGGISLLVGFRLLFFQSGIKNEIKTA